MIQKEALALLKMGHNVFLTGAAGSGKTYLLNQYIAYLREHHVAVGITASTGIAATHMGGVTIHSWSGIGVRDHLEESDLKEIFVRQYLRTRFLKTKVLIIDEISMLHAHQLDMVDRILRTFKSNDLPFGGIQVVMCGDFFQLPPVRKGQEQGSFVNESEVWKDMHLSVCYLDEQFRQDDRAFTRVLNDIRDGEVNEMTVEMLSERIGKEAEGYTKPTRLFTHNADVDAINVAHLQELTGEEMIYHMSWTGSFNLVETLKKTCLAPEVLSLKKGTQVMFVKNNYEQGYVNGTLGEVIDFDENEMPIVRTFDGREFTVLREAWEIKDPLASGHAGQGSVLASIMQIPLRLAWAITVHKSQGMSLDAAEVDLSRSFTPGMGYVALSRVRSLKGLKLMGMNQMALSINEHVSSFDQEFRKQSDVEVLRLGELNKDAIQSKITDFLEYLTNK